MMSNLLFMATDTEIEIMKLRKYRFYFQDTRNKIKAIKSMY